MLLQPYYLRFCLLLLTQFLSNTLAVYPYRDLSTTNEIKYVIHAIPATTADNPGYYLQQDSMGKLLFTRTLVRDDPKIRPVLVTVKTSKVPQAFKLKQMGTDNWGAVDGTRRHFTFEKSAFAELSDHLAVGRIERFLFKMTHNQLPRAMNILPFQSSLLPYISPIVSKDPNVFFGDIFMLSDKSFVPERHLELVSLVLERYHDTPGQTVQNEPVKATPNPALQVIKPTPLVLPKSQRPIVSRVIDSPKLIKRPPVPPKPKPKPLFVPSPVPPSDYTQHLSLPQRPKEAPPDLPRNPHKFGVKIVLKKTDTFDGSKSEPNIQHLLPDTQPTYTPSSPLPLKPAPLRGILKKEKKNFNTFGTTKSLSDVTEDDLYAFPNTLSKHKLKSASDEAVESDNIMKQITWTPPLPVKSKHVLRPFTASDDSPICTQEAQNQVRRSTKSTEDKPSSTSSKEDQKKESSQWRDRFKSLRKAFVVKSQTNSSAKSSPTTTRLRKQNIAHIGPPIESLSASNTVGISAPIGVANVGIPASETKPKSASSDEIFRIYGSPSSDLLFKGAKPKSKHELSKSDERNIGVEASSSHMLRRSPTVDSHPIIIGSKLSIWRDRLAKFDADTLDSLPVRSGSLPSVSFVRFPTVHDDDQSSTTKLSKRSFAGYSLHHPAHA